MALNPKHPIVYTNPGHRPFEGGNFEPLGSLPTLDEALPIVKDFLGQQWKSMVHAPVGNLKHPYLAPGATYHELWDNDSFFTTLGLPDEALEYSAGCVLNLLENINAEGRPPKLAQPDGSLDLTSHPVPLHGQFAWVISRRLNDFSWLEAHWDSLKAIEAWYRRATMRDGLYVWINTHGPMIDNNPAVYGRRHSTCAAPDLAAFHYRELIARARIGRELNRPEAEVEYYTESAAALRTLFRDLYWDNLDQLYYSIDLNNDPAALALQSQTWVTLIKTRNWASLIPLWAGLPTAEQAAAIRQRVVDPAEFFSPGGIRSQSAVDRIYNNEPMGNPSNWQGPVWGLSTFITAYGLARYGFTEDALEAASRLVRVFAADITINGALHETYHGDTQRPLTVPGFISWNMMAYRIIDDLRNGQDNTTYDLLDADPA